MRFELPMFFKPSFMLKIYMRSGNVIEVSHVVDFNIKNVGNEITGVNLTQKNRGSKLLVSTLDLTQIEAVVRVF